MRRRGTKEAGARARMRHASSSSIREGKPYGWTVMIDVGTWVRRRYRQRLVPKSFFGWRGKMTVGWCFAPTAGQSHLNRILIGQVPGL